MLVSSIIYLFATLNPPLPLYLANFPILLKYIASTQPKRYIYLTTEFHHLDIRYNI